MLSYRKRFGAIHGQTVICCDHPYSWRRDKFPYYKASRKADKEESSIDWNELIRIMNLLIEEFKENIPYKVLKIQGAEGDDCIATLAKWFPGPHMIISNDKDFGQLQRHLGVSQYASRKQDLIHVNDPDRFLKEHIIHGDAGDGVPNILSDDDTLVTAGKRQKSVMKKYMETWVTQEFSEMETKPGKADSVKFDPDKIARNIMMIDFASIPKEIENQILLEFQNAKTVPNRHLMMYFGEKKLKALLDEITSF